MSLMPILTHLQSQREAMLTALRSLVEHESPSGDKPALDALAAKLARRFQAIGCEVGMIDNASGGNHLRIRFSATEAAERPPILVLAHYDTVWPIGTIDRLPFRVEAGMAFGPGTYDMKASIVLVEFALAALEALQMSPARPIELLVTSDEEIGSPTSRALIEASARAAACALVVEPPLVGGRLKTARKGVGGYAIEVRGKAAHAGVEPEKGASAILELAHQILKVQALADPVAGTTLNVGIIQGGTTPNVVAESASARVDVRVARLDESERIVKVMQSLQPVIAGTTVRAHGGINRPPMERTPAGLALFETAREVGREIGLDLEHGSTGGGSDGNITAALGIPTLDGLGVDGDGAHADHEHILIDALPERTALLAGLLLRL